MGPDVTDRPFLADEDTNSTDDANRALGIAQWANQCNVAMRVAPPDGQIWNQCK